MMELLKVYIYLNGEFVKSTEAKISPFDHGYMYGLGIFETFRIYNGHPFLLDDHLKRLRSGCKELNIDWNKSTEFIFKNITHLLDLNGWENAYIRLNVSAGNGQIGLQTESFTDPTEIIYAKELPVQQNVVKKEGVILETRRNSPETSFRLKTHHFLNNVIGKREVGNSSTKEGLFLTDEDYLAEGVTSNLFWTSQRTLYTPSLDTGILNGITRQYILRLAKVFNIPIQIDKYRVDSLLAADEVFLTNSIQEIVPVTKISNMSYPGEKGNITSSLITKYKEDRGKLWSRFERKKG
jgi:4-amino-4-deoxychorismate lyase